MSGAGCGCCACLKGAGQPIEVTNRPGLTWFRYRVGTYSTFLDAMIRRLTVPVDEDQAPENYSLHGLRTRESDDPAMALLDAWATVGDILTFYQERYANEAFLRTASERRSILELGRLVGYTLKPGVAASVYLAYTLDDTAKTTIPAGTKAQSIPGVDEQPQMFETSEDIEARGAWNALRPRMSRPQEITIENVLELKSIWIDGTTTRLETRDPILFVFEDEAGEDVYAIRWTLKFNVDLERKRTEVVLEPARPYYVALAKATYKDVTQPPKSKTAKAEWTALKPQREEFLHHVLLGVPRTALQAAPWLANLKDTHPVKVAALGGDPSPQAGVGSGGPNIAQLLEPLVKPRGIAPATRWQLGRSLTASLGERSDFKPRLLTAFYPQLEETLYTALANNASGDKPYTQFRSVHVLRRRRAVFGYNAPTLLFEDRTGPKDEHNGHDPTIVTASAGTPQPPMPTFVIEAPDVLYLDTPDDAITVGSFVVTRSKAYGPIVAEVLETEGVSRTAYGISGTTTRLTLNRNWWEPVTKEPDTDEERLKAMKRNLLDIRTSPVLCESEELTLAQAPVLRHVGKIDPKDPGDPESEKRIELDSVVEGLAPGRWVIVSGERDDTQGTSGVVSAELAMIDNVDLWSDAGAGGTAYSVLVLAPKGLAYGYKRETVKIYGNVVKATNGETRAEILGGGDATVPLQTFTLHQSPLTFVAAPTVAGVVSTLAVRVNQVLWHEIDTLADAGPTDHVFVTTTADDGKVSVTLGTGRQGARAPSGPDNVRAVYRSGIGRGANVRAGQIATAISRPLGVRDVVNPIRASGGADPESRDDARRNIPVSLQAMGRVVSVQDYADFARTFAGIAKASAVALSDGRRRLVHLTIGGAEDIEIDVTSDLFRNLGEAIRRYGDPYQPFLVAIRARMVIAGVARVKVDPDYLWEYVGPKVRAALLDQFSYDRRDFGQPVYPAEVVATIQHVPGVVAVDLDALGAIRATDLVRFPTKPGGAVTDPKLAQITGVKPILPLLADQANRQRGTHQRRSARRQLRAAEIAYLPPELAELFVLNEITND
jgi:hypothetical protein